MAPINKTIRDSYFKWVEDYASLTKNHVGIVATETYERAFFDDDDRASIHKARQKTWFDGGTQANLTFQGMDATSPALVKTLAVNGEFNFLAPSRPIAWARYTEIEADLEAYATLRKVAYEVLENAIEIALFKKAALLCTELTNSHDQLCWNFPPFVQMYKRAGHGKIADQAEKAMRMKPLPLTGWQRNLVKHALNWCAIQQLSGTLTNNRIPSGHMRMQMANSHLREVTFVGNDSTEKLLF